MCYVYTTDFVYCSWRYTVIVRFLKSRHSYKRKNFWLLAV